MSVPIAGLLAVHFKTVDDVRLFGTVVTSIASQSSRLSFVAMNISTDAGLHVMCAASIATWRKLFDQVGFEHDLQLEPSGARRSQFEHYRVLYDRVFLRPGIGETWLLFGDADDFWSPRRVEINTRYVLSRAPGKLAFISHTFRLMRQQRGTLHLGKLIRGLTTTSRVVTAVSAVTSSNAQSQFVIIFKQTSRWTLSKVRALNISLLACTFRCFSRSSTASARLTRPICPRTRFCSPSFATWPLALMFTSLTNGGMTKSTTTGSI
jgi:hypothetical protein